MWKWKCFSVLSLTGRAKPMRIRIETVLICLGALFCVWYLTLKIVNFWPSIKNRQRPRSGDLWPGHGTCIQIGKTKLLCHVHPGSETCLGSYINSLPVILSLSRSASGVFHLLSRLFYFYFFLFFFVYFTASPFALFSFCSHLLFFALYSNYCLPSPTPYHLLGICPITHYLYMKRPVICQPILLLRIWNIYPGSEFFFSDPGSGSASKNSSI